MPYKPAKHKTRPCALRSEADLLQAADALGRVLVVGCRTSRRLQQAARNPLHPLHVPQDHDSDQYRDLLMMMVSERWWLEFLLGPADRADDVCVDCFVQDWRLPAGPLAEELSQRKRTINKLLLHPTWRLIDQSPREWTLTRVAACADGLEMFILALEPTLPSVAQRFRSYLVQARSALKGEAPLAGTS